MTTWAWDEGAGTGRAPRSSQFTQAEAERWLREGHRLTASAHERLWTQQGLLWSPGGALDEPKSGSGSSSSS